MKIVDTFTFFNELDILEMRFEVLYPHVDWFVIVEANQTFTLKHSPKEFEYGKNIERFRKYNDKVILVQLEDEFAAGNPWANEFHQRNSIGRGLSQLITEGKICDQDMIIMSDIDEIPDPRKFGELSWVREGEVATFKHKMYRYYLNLLCTHELWKGSRALSFKTLTTRFDGKLEPLRHINEIFIQGGWHYTGMGGMELFIKKMQSFCHADICDTPEYTDLENMKKLFKEKVIDKGVDIHHFNNATYMIEEDPSQFLPPQCQEEDYSHLIYK